MKEPKVLKILDKFKFVFKINGINYTLMRSILKLKLTIDGRRVPTILSNNNKKNEDKDKNMFFSSLWVYMLFGLFMMFLILIDIPMYVKMSLNIGMNMFMLMTTMISDFSSVLLNVKDKYILMTKPIDARTYNAAKIVHILIYLFSIAMSLNLLSIIGGTVKYGVLFLLLYLIELIFICMFILFITSLTYHIVLKFFDGEKLKDMINTFQIILSIVMVVGYQVLVRTFSIIDMDITFTLKWWSYLIPPIWFAAPYELLLGERANDPMIILSILTLLIPLVSMWIHLKIIAPRFEHNLLKLNMSTGQRMHRKTWLLQLKNKFYRSLSPSNMESNFIRFTQNILKSERKLKLKIYPNLAFAPIFPFLILYTEFTANRSFAESLSKIGRSNSYFSMYLSIWLLTALFGMVIFSESYKGAWIYKTLPIDNPSTIMKGAFKGFVLKYYCLIYVLISSLSLLIYGDRIILDLVIMFLVLLVMTIMAFQFGEKKLPFSKSINATVNNTASFFKVSIVIGLLAGVHYFVRNMFLIKIGYTFIIFLVLIIAYHKVFNCRWEEVS